MILTSAALALRDVVSPPFRAALWKVLGLTILVLIALWFGVRALAEGVLIPFFARFTPDMPAWVENAGTFAGLAAGSALAFVMASLIAPIGAVIAGLFLDDVAAAVETRSYPDAPPGRALPFVRGMVLSARFFGIVVLGNLLAFALLLVPGVNLVAFVAVNGYLIGREYFEFAAMRYRPEGEAKALRARHRGTVFLAGLLVAAVLAVPILNLAAALFAASLMVHLHQRISRRDGLALIPAPRPAAAPGGRAA